ncbi:MAG TPA: hypothetical protein DCP11_14010, partial [Microbacteriaceae bacterium]|jgi:hypothetical protein|nr:hypothetical protein [Microbacteriaceae bacterium]
MPDERATDHDEAAEPSSTIAAAKVRIRRAPRYPIFLIVGAGLGAIVTLVLTALFPADPSVGFGPLFGYFAIYGIPAGVVLGALVALVLDRVSTRRAKSIVMEHTTVDPLPLDVEAPADEKAPDSGP